MKNTSPQDLTKKIIIWLLAIVTVLYLVSGVGITEFRIVETVTFGLLTKNLAFMIHNNLWIPFITLLVLHVCLQLIFKRKAKEVKP
jgi:cytochrome b subunit of formate dehydrogenase